MSGILFNWYKQHIMYDTFYALGIISQIGLGISALHRSFLFKKKTDLMYLYGSLTYLHIVNA